MIKIVMYHYVRPADGSGLNYMSLAQFRRQLDFFQKDGGVISQSDWNEFKLGKPTKGYLLTFDDGLLDHYDFVLPELLQRKLFGIFFVCTDPMESKKPLTVHLLHAALAIKNPLFILKNIEEITDIRIADIDDSIVTETYRFQNSNDIEKSAKRIVNYEKYPLGVRASIETFLLGLLQINKEDFCINWYMNPLQCVEMQDAGMAIGSHSVSHRLLKNLTDEEVDFELRQSKAFLTGLGLHISEFCYPYGGKKSFSEVQKPLVGEYYSFAHSVDPHELIIESNDCLELPRYDCNYWQHN